MDARWLPLKNKKVNEDDAELHIKMLPEDQDQKWGFKIEDAVKEDRRGYKCVVFNKTQPANCTESVFFVRVKDKYAALWPFLGIVAEVIALCAIIFICEHGRSSKDDYEDDELNGNGVGGGQRSGAGENSSIRHRRT